MRLMINMVLLVWSSMSFSQVLLSERVNIASQRDAVFPSAKDPKIAYFVPHMLYRMSEVKVISVGDRIKVQFDVGVPDSEFARIDSLLQASGHTEMKASLIRGIEAHLDPKGGVDLDDSYRPVVTIAGDINDIAGPVRYTLSVRNKGPKGPKNRTALMLQKIFSAKAMDNIANVQVYFDAVSVGAPYKGRYTLAVMAHENEVAPPFLIPPKGISSELSFVSAFVPNLEEKPEIQILFDKDTGCWAKSEPGIICLK